MRVLVAGGAGFIGSRLVPALRERGYQVEVIDLLWFGNQLPPDVPVHRRDLFDLTEADLSGFDQVVLKILFMMGGEGVIKLSASDPEFRVKAQRFMVAAGREPVLAQEFLPAVSGGDKRVFVLNGEPFAALKRLPKAGDFRANLAVGGTAAAGELDDDDRAIAAAVAPLTKQLFGSARLSMRCARPTVCPWAV